MIHQLLNEQSSPTVFEQTFTVPGADKNFTFKMRYLPSLENSPVVEFLGANVSEMFLVDYIPSTFNEVFLREETGELIFFSGDTGKTGTLRIKRGGSLVDADTFNESFCWLKQQRFINGVPPYQEVVSDGSGGWDWGFPVHSFYIPGDIAESITIKRLTIWAQSLEGVTVGAGFETRIGVSVVDRGRPNDFASVGFSGNEYEEGVNGASVALHSLGWGSGNNEGWYRATAEADLLIDLSNGGVWLNIFTLDNRAQHSNITIEIGAV